MTKSPLSIFHRIPLVGYVTRLMSSLARLPVALTAYEQGIGRLQETQQALEARIASESLALSDRAAAIEAQVAAVEARRQDTAQQLAACGAEVHRLRSGLDTHLPTFLNMVSSHGATTRLLRREQAEMLGKVRALLDEERRAVEADRAAREAGEAGFRKDVDERLAGVDMALGAAHRTLAGIENAVRGLEARAAPDAPAADRLQAEVAALRDSVSYLLQRVEFVRRETLFELRYGKAPSGEAANEPRILAPEKLESARAAGLRVNVGCGHIPEEGYVNVDSRELPGVDVVAEATRMPFERGSVAEVFSSHLLEHFPQEQLRREVLPYWKSLLRPGGKLRSVVPDAKAMIEKYGEGVMPWEDLREVTFGGQDYEGDFHFTMFTPESLRALLQEAGFRDISFPVTGRANGKCYEMEFEASA